MLASERGHVERRSLVADLGVIKEHEGLRRARRPVVHAVARDDARVRVVVQVEVRHVRARRAERLRDGQQRVVRRVRRPVRGGRVVRCRWVEEVVGDPALARVDVCAGVPDARELQRVVHPPHRRTERIGHTGDPPARSAVEFAHRDGDVRSVCGLDSIELPLRQIDYYVRHGNQSWISQSVIGKIYH